MTESLTIRPLTEADCETIPAAFRAQGWDKPAAQYRGYLREAAAGKRAVLVAEVHGQFAGYATLVWESDYPPFRERNIPEIADLNVLRAFQRRGIASALMDAAESLAAARSLVVGIGVGLTADYGPAQRLYIRRGYIPDGRGACQRGFPVRHGQPVTVDDDLLLYLTRPVARAAESPRTSPESAASDPNFQSKLKEIQDLLENL
jgi:GNAT superfamily N-acetyltransferase